MQNLPMDMNFNKKFAAVWPELLSKNKVSFFRHPVCLIGFNSWIYYFINWFIFDYSRIKNQTL